MAWRPKRREVLLACCVALHAHAAAAARVELPLRIALAPLHEALSAHLAASPVRLRTVYRDGPCRYLVVGNPRLHARNGELRVAGAGSAALGVELGGECRTAAAWRGLLHFAVVPRIDAAGRLSFRIADSWLTDAKGARQPAADFAWDLVKRHVHPRLERFGYDLGAARDALLGLLRAAAPPRHAAALAAALATVSFGEPRVEGASLAVPVAFDVPDAWLAAAPPASSAPLAEAELEALDRALQPWDAFLLYSVKQLALDWPDASLRRRLLTLLLDSRHRLADVLSGEAGTAGDPVRELFVETWEELRAIAADARRAGMPGGLFFIEAGDALLALDRAAPGLGLQVSAAGLRRLARTLRPADAGDPLAFAWDVDPELLRLFEVTPIAAPAPALPPPLPSPPPRTNWLDFLVPLAHAAPAPVPRRTSLLDPWVPGGDEIDAYTARIAELLEKTSTVLLERADLAAAHARIYERLVPTTALIESCWRQYVARGGRIRYLQSPAHSVGIMQVNQRVWRGFYDVQRLRWDTAYNALAGAQILMRYLEDYAIPYARRTGEIGHVARAAYAVYNAGPRAVGRFNKKKPHPREKRVDERLWRLYRGFATGGSADLRTCSVSAPPAD